MAINFPTTLDTLTNPVATDNTVTVSHATQHANVNDIVEALEAKVGVDTSAVATSLDYLVTNASSSDPGHVHTTASVTDTLVNLDDTNISSPQEGNGIFYDSASGKWINADTSVADATIAVKGVVVMSTAPVSATDPISVGDNDTRVPSQDENNALAGTQGTPSATNKYVTNDDVTEAKTASRIPRRDSNSDVLVATTPTAGDAAGSKTYIDTQVATKLTGLNTWASATVGSSTLAGTDMIITGYLTVTAGSAIQIKTDSSNPPTTIRTAVATGSNDDILPFSVPVKDGEYYLIEYTNGSAGVTAYTLSLE
ncbi:MAG: hypothetical protein GY861_18330 [bacterium]|nr:hypothetical protein [bacterium]